MDNVAVIGAGAMGTGIAQAFASAGVAVGLYDADPAAADEARTRIDRSLQKALARGQMDDDEKQAALARITAAGTLSQATFEADLVIEAIVENREAKRRLLGEVEPMLSPSAIIATNTSSFRVASLTTGLARPQRMVGLHFFFPAHVNPLVEVVQAPRTDDTVFQAAWDAVAAIGKQPLRVHDSPGFCVNRFLLPWMNEACRLLEEGHDVPSIEAAAKDALPVAMGPFAVMNLSGLAVCHHAMATLGQEIDPRYAPAQVLREQMERGVPWDLEGPVKSLPETALRRLRGVVWQVCHDIVDEGVATAEDVDRGARIGLAWSKGPFECMAQAGADAVAGDREAWTGHTQRLV